MAKRIVAALAIILMLAAECAMLAAQAPREQSKAVLRTFSDGNSTETMFFEDPGNNTSISLKMPQRVTILGAAVNISGQATTYNDTINDTTRDDFLNMNLSNIDVNSSSGDAMLGKPLDDNFNDQSLDPKWKWRNASAYDEGNVTPGALVLSANPNTTFWNGTNNGSLLYQNITGSGAYTWQVTVKVNCTPSAPGQRAGILLFWNRSNWVDFSVGRNATTKVLSRINTTNNVSLAVNMSIGPGPVWLRFFRYYYNYFYFYYSTDGQNFSLVNSMNLTWIYPFTATDMSVGLDIMDGGSGTAFNATFDDYNVNRYCTSGYLISQVREYKDEVQSAQLHWNMSLGSFGTNFAVSARVSPGDGDWKTLLNDAQFDFYPKGYMFQYNVTMSGTGDSWSVPVFRWIWGNITVKSIPTNVSIDLGDKGTPDWKQPGTLGDHPTRLNITSAVISAVAAAVPDPNGDVTIPVRVQSDKRGTVTLSDLAIEYVVNSPPLQPDQQTPSNATWVTTKKPTLNFNATDPDGGEIWYTIEVSGAGSPFRLDQRISTNGWSAQSYQSGAQASYTFPYELANGVHYSWSVRAYDGFAYGPWSPKKEFYVDETPPEGWVVDDGADTSDGTSLHANLNITDPESGIVGYEVWVGTARNASDIVPLTEVNTSSVTFSNLTLIYGYKYYFTARAQNGAGLWSQNYSSDGIGVKKGAVNHLPSVSLSYPADGANLTGVVKFRGNATDIDFLDLLTASVQVDNSDWMDGEGNRSWSLSWDSSRVQNGRHSIHVRTSDGRAYSETINLNVSIQNVHEILITGAEPAADPRISENQSVGFSLSARDPFNRTLSYQWLVDGTPVTGATSPAFTYRSDYSSAGTHNVTVTAFISPLETHFVWNVSVANVNRPPVPTIGAPVSGTEVDSGKQVIFDATGSHDPDTTDTLNYSWDFGDGNQAGGLQPSHAYQKAGRYIVTLTVSDPFTYSTTSIEVLVKEGPNAAPGLFDQYGMYIMAGLVLVIALALAAAAVTMRRKEPTPTAKAPSTAKGPVEDRAGFVAERKGAPQPRTGMPTEEGRPPARAPAPPARRPEPAEYYGGVLTAADEPGTRQPEQQAPAWTEPEYPVHEAPPVVQAGEAASGPAWAMSSPQGPAYHRVDEAAWPQPAETDMTEQMYPAEQQQIPEVATEPLEAPVEPIEPPMDEMTRILNMLAPPEEAAPAPAPQEEESSGMEDVFAKLRSISEEFETGPAAVAPAPPAPAPREIAPKAPAPREIAPKAPAPREIAPQALTPRPTAPTAPAPRRAELRPEVKAAAPRRPAAAPSVPARPAAPAAPKVAPAVAAAPSPAAGKKRLLRCPKCQVIFEVQDTGVRPLPIKCTACGTTGSLKK
jgi:hypothetical protein